MCKCPVMFAQWQHRLITHFSDCIPSTGGIHCDCPYCITSTLWVQNFNTGITVTWAVQDQKHEFLLRWHSHGTPYLGLCQQSPAQRTGLIELALASSLAFLPYIVPDTGVLSSLLLTLSSSEFSQRVFSFQKFHVVSCDFSFVGGEQSAFK